ncbi:MAG: lipoyl(octanoyl) transferase LipB [Geitlerinemataceae cyanobacterium]
MTHAVRCFYVRPLVPYAVAWAWQRRLVEQRRQNPELEDVLILLEHPPVYTLGRGSNPAFLKFDPAASDDEVHEIERGGEVTHHCPGQLVGYPILNLKRYQPDLHWYLRRLEAVVMGTIAAFGVTGDRVEGLTGVWVGDRKLAAIGIKVSRWISMHGFALNVCPDLSGFDRIVPCGISDKRVGSLAQFVPGVTVANAIEPVVRAFGERFEVAVTVEEIMALDDSRLPAIELTAS